LQEIHAARLAFKAHVKLDVKFRHNSEEKAVESFGLPP
jgi:hypothetical protein